VVTSNGKDSSSGLISERMSPYASHNPDVHRRLLLTAAWISFAFWLIHSEAPWNFLGTLWRLGGKYVIRSSLAIRSWKGD
jgi:hypothetical protein